MFRRTNTFLTLTLLLSPTVFAEDWPQWRGQTRDGRSTETGLLGSWPDDGPPVAWRASGLGTGYASVAVHDGRVLTTGDLQDGQYLIAIEQHTGKTLWKTKIGPIWEDNYPGARSTPAIDGDRVYALSTEGELVCAKIGDGTIVWQRNLITDFSGELMLAMGQYMWKYSESPLVDGERVIVTPGHRKAALVALDKKTGKEVWRTALPELGPEGTDGAGYASAIAADIHGVRQYVQLVGRGAVGVEAATGRLLWSYNRVANDVANIPTAIVDGNRVFVSSGYGTGAALLEIERKEGAFEAREIYFLEGDTFQNHHGGMILHEGHVYTGTGHNKGFPLAIDMGSGKIAWGPERNAGRNSAAIAYADGHLYFRYQNGLMVLIEATPSGYKEKGSFMIPDVERESWAHPVISGGQLLLREQDTLIAYDLRTAKEG